MQLNLPTRGLDAYTSHSQRARVATESWAAKNLYCPNCTCNTLTAYAPGKPALDYACESCDAPFQLKSQSKPFTSRIVDAGYDPSTQTAHQTSGRFNMEWNPGR
jgi:type II restriction enzyme